MKANARQIIMIATQEAARLWAEANPEWAWENRYKPLNGKPVSGMVGPDTPVEVLDARMDFINQYIFQNVPQEIRKAAV